MALKTDLIGYWSFNNSANVDDDHSTYDFSNSGSTYTSSGKLSGARSFDGSNDYLYTSYQTWGFSDAWSINLWLKADTLSAEQCVLMFKANGLSTNLINMSFGLNGQNQKIAVQAYNDGSGRKFYLGNSSLSTGTWYMITATWDGTYLKIYVDGSEDTPYTKDTDNSISMADSSRQFRIAENIASSAANFDGIIDDISLHSRALTSSEITEIYNSGSGLAYSSWDVTPSTADLQLNIGDSWKDVSALQVNIGDVWKSVSGAQVNIGDSWKEIF